MTTGRAPIRTGPWPYAAWALTRAWLLACVFKVVTVAGPDVTVDVSVIYRSWYEVLLTGTYPLDDVTWQYPPGAAVAILSPALLPFWEYATAFFVLVLVCDALVLGLLLYAGRRPGMRAAGAWVWVVGVPLLGPTVYARYDLMVTAVAVAALLAGVRRPRALGVLAAFGALLKGWPALLLVGVRKGRPTRAAWSSAALSAAGLAAAFALWMPGAFAFLAFQRDRGTEVESLGALVFHIARQFGWEGRVELRYGSLEFVGPRVELVSTLALGLAVLALGWLLLWRLRARSFAVRTPAEAAFTAVLLFTVTSRVISPQYVVWLVGLAAVCLVFRGTAMTLPAVLVLVAAGVTLLEFPIGFAHVVASDAWGVTLLVVRNGLLVAASLVAARRLWRSTVPGRPGADAVPGAVEGQPSRVAR
ncbi:Phosphoglycerol transferase and related proteins, alkaline phosphatase superfamily [Streptomyces sp. Ncost-T6T-1]|uniref:glycosyltransferase 87 family protein n=1 Tax=Streptomyces sp. Ncost-T6T-1 TaxID=1100828 RepID=UPI00080564AA|nr:glycosyltransferase 87 family protein [Streptomyces sp. Ncost-T6T-1]SBU88804.1 Phosphoglycerol transferase and related proteins, alkaline phosphatase superfamily [Streptomyces sp. Ncost-T6T-1]